MKEDPRLSVIIPVNGLEVQLPSLVETLTLFFTEQKLSFELILCLAPDTKLEEKLAQKKLKVLFSKKKMRSVQLNLGAENSTGDWLLFIHADSVLDENFLRRVVQISRPTISDPDTLYYGHLRFEFDGPKACILNAFFANLRSKYFKLPFGDQGYLIKRSVFFKLGLFPNHFISGEDHAFIKKAQGHQVLIHPLGGGIKTSARKYQKEGWLKVTAKHLYLTFKQEIYSIKEYTWK